MKKFRLVVRIDNGDTIKGCPIVGDEETLQKLHQMLEQVNDLEYIAIDMDNGRIYMPKSMIQRSYFQIEILG